MAPAIATNPWKALVPAGRGLGNRLSMLAGCGRPERPQRWHVRKTAPVCDSSAAPKAPNPRRRPANISTPTHAREKSLSSARPLCSTFSVMYYTQHTTIKYPPFVLDHHRPPNLRNSWPARHAECCLWLRDGLSSDLVRPGDAEWQLSRHLSPSLRGRGVQVEYPEVVEGCRSAT